MKEKITVIGFIVLLVLSATSFSGCIEVQGSYIPLSILGDNWQENKTAAEQGARNFGLEKWVTLIYEKEGDYPGSLCVTSLKTLMLMDEKDLLQGVKESVFEQAESQGLRIIEDSLSMGSRENALSHQTRYFTCNATMNVNLINQTNTIDSGEGFPGIISGFKTVVSRLRNWVLQWLGQTNLSERVKIIGEVWNCGESGESVICMGIASLTKPRLIREDEWDTSSWRELVADPYGTFVDPHPETNEKVYGNGLVFNVVCH